MVRRDAQTAHGRRCEPRILPDPIHPRRTDRLRDHVHPHRLPAAHGRQLPPELLPVLRRQQARLPVRAPAQLPGPAARLHRVPPRRRAAHEPTARLAARVAHPLPAQLQAGRPGEPDRLRRVQVPRVQVQAGGGRAEDHGGGEALLRRAREQ